MINAITNEVLNRIRSLVCNQARYQVATSFTEEHNIDYDAFYNKADAMTDGNTKWLLVGTALLDDTNLLHLAEKVGVSALYTQEGWLDDVGEYISEHKASCYPLWHFINRQPNPS